MAQAAELTLGERILVLRKRRRWRLEDLAEASGLSTSMLSRYERGLSMPPADALRDIARALGTSPDYLLAFEVDRDTARELSPLRAVAA
jgi:transcriptional regulator with XRE-family HTH domain